MAACNADCKMYSDTLESDDIVKSVGFRSNHTVYLWLLRENNKYFESLSKQTACLGGRIGL